MTNKKYYGKLAIAALISFGIYCAAIWFHSGLLAVFGLGFFVFKLVRLG